MFALDGTFHAIVWPSAEALEHEFRRPLFVWTVLATTSDSGLSRLDTTGLKAGVAKSDTD